MSIVVPIWLSEPAGRLRATATGVGYILGLLFKEVPVAATLITLQSFAAGAHHAAHCLRHQRPHR